MLMNIPILFYSSLSLLFYFTIIIFIIDNDNNGDDDEAAVLPKLVLLFDFIQSYCNSNPIMLKFIAILLFLILIFPIITTIIAYISDLPRRRRCRSTSTASSTNSTTLPLLPFLPDSEHVSKEEYDSVYKVLTANTMKLKQQQQEKEEGEGEEEEETDKDNNNWAIITGASKGIGRAIGISLARRGRGKIDGIILVARNKEKLDLLSNEIKKCFYGIQTLVVKCDITSDEDISDMIKIIKEKQLNITILIANAGVGDRADFLNMTHTKMELILNTNIVGTTKLIHMIATQLMIKNNKKKSKQQKHQNQNQSTNKRKRKRMIVLMSSITGSVPGVPSSAVYAASKAYQRSFCSSLSRELESLDEDDDDDDDGSAVQVQCIMPGAVKETNFSNIANMNNTPFFYQQNNNRSKNKIDIATKFGLTLTPEYVAECTVEEMFNGKAKQEVYVGWIYVFIGRIAGDLLPRRLVLLACELTFSDTILPSILSCFTSIKSSSSESKSESQHKKEE
jgi:short-subunit dehydrogenase